MKITKRQLKRIITEEKRRLVREMNPDGTISGDEDAEREALMADVEEQMFDLIQHVYGEAERIGGSFRSPGIKKSAYELMSNMIREV